MKAAELKAVKKLIVGLAEYLQTTVTEAQLLLYANEFQDIGAAGLGEAIIRLKQDPDIWPGKFPLPAKVKSYLRPPIDSEAKKTVALIFECVQKYGNTKQQEAKDYMGEFAWSVCKQYGGFGNICNMETHHKPTVYAQLRDLAENTMYRERNHFGVPQVEERISARKITGPDKNGQSQPTEIGSILHQVLPENT